MGKSDQYAVHKLLSKSYAFTGRRQDAIKVLEAFLARGAVDDPSRTEVEAELKKLNEAAGG